MDGRSFATNSQCMRPEGANTLVNETAQANILVNETVHENKKNRPKKQNIFKKI